MDATIRARLLDMRSEYSHTGLGLLKQSALLQQRRADADHVKADITAETTAAFPEKSNDIARRAGIEKALADDSGYQTLLTSIQEHEVNIKGYQLVLEALRFELQCLQTIANNDLSTPA